MLSKPLSLILVYILGIANFMLVLTPFVVVGLMLNYIGGYYIPLYVFRPWILLAIFLISFLMLLYMLADFVFGIYVKDLVKMCHDYRVDSSYKIFHDIFVDIKKKFRQKNVELLIMESSKVNAFAVGSMRKKYIVLTLGLIREYYRKSGGNTERFLSAIKGILGHEMSHLINQDFLPGLLMSLNKKITFGIQKKIAKTLKILTRLVRSIPFVGIFFHLFVNMFFTINNIGVVFYNVFVIRIYYFFKALISKRIEYRCDKQSARACGGEMMSYSLSLLPGKKGYTTIFSTHPSTPRRIKKARKIKKKRGVIRSGLMTKLSNILAIFGLVWISAFCGKNARIPQLTFLYYFFMYYLRLITLQLRYIFN